MEKKSVGNVSGKEGLQIIEEVENPPKTSGVIGTDTIEAAKIILADKDNEGESKLWMSICDFKSKEFESLNPNMIEITWITSNNVLPLVESRVAAYKKAEKIFSCLNCTFTGNLRRIAEHYIGIHYPKLVFKCSFCSYENAWSRTVKQHIKLHHWSEFSINPNTCNYLNDNSEVQKVIEYLRNLRWDIQQIIAEISEPPKAKVTKSEKAAEKKKEKFQCKNCSYSTISKYKLYKVHARTHLGGRFICYICGWSFLRVDHIRRHFAAKHGDHQFEMDKAINDKISKKFEGERVIFRCSHCPWEGLEKWSLKRHENTHSKPVSCKLCIYACATTNSLEKHMRNLHRTHVCTKCNFSSANLEEVLRHKKEIHIPRSQVRKNNDTKPHNTRSEKFRARMPGSQVKKGNSTKPRTISSDECRAPSSPKEQLERPIAPQNGCNSECMQFTKNNLPSVDMEVTNHEPESNSAPQSELSSKTHLQTPEESPIPDTSSLDANIQIKIEEIVDEFVPDAIQKSECCSPVKPDVPASFADSRNGTPVKMEITETEFQPNITPKSEKLSPLRTESPIENGTNSFCHSSQGYPIQMEADYVVQVPPKNVLPSAASKPSTSSKLPMTESDDMDYIDARLVTHFGIPVGRKFMMTAIIPKKPTYVRCVIPISPEKTK